MKLLYSHRGNINSIQKDWENHPNYIEQAIKSGFKVEVDVRYQEEDSTYWFGHDTKQYSVSRLWIYAHKNDIIYHAKDNTTLYKLTEYGTQLHYFAHDKDDAVLTSFGLLWTYMNKQLTPGSIAVLPELTKDWVGLENCVGICSDYISRYRDGG